MLCGVIKDSAVITWLTAAPLALFGVMLDIGFFSQRHELINSTEKNSVYQITFGLIFITSAFIGASLSDLFGLYGYELSGIGEKMLGWTVTISGGMTLFSLLVMTLMETTRKWRHAA